MEAKMHIDPTIETNANPNALPRQGKTRKSEAKMPT